VPVQELIRAVKEHRLEGIIAKRAGSRYRSGERCEDWLKWRAHRGQEFVIGGYVPNGAVLDSILVGYYDKRDLMYAARVRPGLSSELRRILLPQLEALKYVDARSVTCPSAATDIGARVSRPRKWLCAVG
jgi:ATP-dependent DNA ligase